MRVKAMEESARLSRRSPPRLRRWRSVFPEDAGMGQVPESDAKAASERIRPPWDQATRMTAALTVPMPIIQELGGSRSGNQSGELLFVASQLPLG